MGVFFRPRLRRAFLRLGAGILLAGAIASIATHSSAQQPARPPRYAGYIGGTVQSSQGKEAGVWVIAETNELQTKFIKIVITDDQGRLYCLSYPKPRTTYGCVGTGSLIRCQ